MLVLTRKPGEKLMIGENITVTVVAVGRGRVRLALEAPDHVRILRAELTDRRELGCEPDLELEAKPLEWEPLRPFPNWSLAADSKPLPGCTATPSQQKDPSQPSCFGSVGVTRWQFDKVEKSGKELRTTLVLYC